MTEAQREELKTLQAETLSQKNRRFIQAICEHDEVYSSTVTTRDGTHRTAFCLDCGKSF